MSHTERTQTYWREGRLHPITVDRPTGRGPWPKVSAYAKTEHVATIEGGNGDFSLVEGPMATPDRVNDSILLHRGIAPTKLTRDAWDALPQTLVSRLWHHIKGAEDAVASQWKQFSNEEAMTGALFTRLDGEFQVGRWKFSLRFVEFSKQAKEPTTGTDVAVVLDVVLADGRRSFKTIWFQAKRHLSEPNGSNQLPRFSNQAQAASTFTDDFYGLVFTPTGVYVTGTTLGPGTQLHTALEQAMRCRLGDMTVRTLKNSLNRKRVFEISLTQAA